MNFRQKIVGLLAFGFMLAACNTPTPPAVTFKLKPAETTLEIPAGSQATSFVALERDAGFSDLVQMTIQDLPAGFSQEWTRDTSNGDCGVRLVVGKDVAPGEYNLKVVGLIGADAKNANIQSRASVAVSTVVKVLVPDLAQSFPFSFTTSPTVFSAEPGFTAKFGINIGQLKAGFEENVQLSIENLPLGVTASFSKNPVKVLSGISSTIATLAIANNTLPGTYAMRVVGTSPSSTRATIVQLTVLPPTTQGFKLTTTAVRDTFMQERGTNQDGLIQLTLERKAGFSAPVELSAQNLPADTQINLPGTVSGSSTGRNLLMQAGFASAQGTHTFTIKGTGGGVVNTIPVTITIQSRFQPPEATNIGLNALESSFSNSPVAGFRILRESQQGFFELNAPSRQPLAILADSNNKVLVSAGFGNTVARLNQDGTLDSSFGVGGLSPQLTSGNASLTNITGFALQADNKILINGARVVSDIDGNEDIRPAVARLNANGSLDTSFGTGGVKVIVETTGFSLALAQIDLGRILIVTASEIIRLTSGGNLDPDFDTDGRKPINLPNTDPGFGRGIVGATDSQKRFVIVANASITNVKQLRVFRVLQDGSIDSSYSGNGTTMIDTQLNSVGIALDAQDRLLMPTFATPLGSESLFRIVRLNSTGAFDTSFDTDGQAQFSFSADAQSARAITVLPSNKIMVVGTARLSLQNAPIQPNGDFAALRLNENGSLDTTFGTDGKFLMGVVDQSKSATTGFTELFGAVVGLPNGGAMAFGTGFGNTVIDGRVFVTVAKFKP